MELSPCHPSATLNLEVTPRFLEHLCSPAVVSPGYCPALVRAYLGQFFIVHNLGETEYSWSLYFRFCQSYALK